MLAIYGRGKFKGKEITTSYSLAIILVRGGGGGGIWTNLKDSDIRQNEQI